jgi:adenosylcobyric acid synthase
MGETISEKQSPTCKIESDKNDGYFLNEKTWGTYIHGIFDNNEIVKNVLAASGKEVNTEIDFKKFKEQQYDKLATLIRESTDMEYIYKSIGLEAE